MEMNEMKKTYAAVYRGMLYAERYERIGHLVVNAVRNSKAGYSMALLLTYTGCGRKVVDDVANAVYHGEEKALASALGECLVRIRECSK